ncbi:MAG: sensor histidine kinase [Mycobacteriales bacterium]
MRLRNRLLAVTTLTLGTGMAVAGVAGNLLFAHAIAADQNERLSARLQAITASLSIDRTGRVQIHSAFNDSELDRYAWIFTASGKLLEQPAAVPRALTDQALGLAHSVGHNSGVRRGDVLMGSQQLKAHGRPVATVVAGVSITQFQTLRREVLLGTIAVAAFILILGSVAMRRALNAALAPVERMTNDAEDWNAHDLDRRFGLGPATDEITSLAATLDHLMARIASSRRHEQRFAAEIAHELRTPLAAIRGVAELNAERSTLEETHTAFRQIEDESRRIGLTLDTLMAFARSETNPAADGVDLESVVADFQDVTIHHASAPLPRAEGDVALIRQILAPLIDNARRHADHEVTVELGASGDRALISVRDDGPGVEPGLGDTIFQPGVRGSTRTGDGAGLGLPLARRLAASCGGEITVGGGPGGCFVLSLPVVATVAPQHQVDRLRS